MRHLKKFVSFNNNDDKLNQNQILRNFIIDSLEDYWQESKENPINF
jgi:hypothetical protein